VRGTNQRHTLLRPPPFPPRRQPTRNRLAATSPRACRNPYSPDTIDNLRRTVLNDTPAWSSATGLSTPSIDGCPVRCAITNASTSAGRTSCGALPTTVKNTFRS
jgi:hypothetical protein